MITEIMDPMPRRRNTPEVPSGHGQALKSGEDSQHMRSPGPGCPLEECMDKWTEKARKALEEAEQLRAEMESAKGADATQMVKKALRVKVAGDAGA